MLMRIKKFLAHFYEIWVDVLLLRQQRKQLDNEDHMVKNHCGKFFLVCMRFMVNSLVEFTCLNETVFSHMSLMGFTISQQHGRLSRKKLIMKKRVLPRMQRCVLAIQQKMSLWVMMCLKIAIPSLSRLMVYIHGKEYVSLWIMK